MRDIKVGSEWVGKYGAECEVTATGKKGVLAYFHGSLAELHYTKDDFLKKFKPAPVRRTVWLNVYPSHCECHEDKEYADMFKVLPDLLYQQEVELIDPRNSDRGRNN